MNKRLMSSTFSSLLGDSGHLIKMSIRSRKLTRMEWFSFRSSFFLSISFVEYSLLIPCNKKKIEPIKGHQPPRKICNIFSKVTWDSRLWIIASSLLIVTPNIL